MTDTEQETKKIRIAGDADFVKECLNKHMKIFDDKGISYTVEDSKSFSIIKIDDYNVEFVANYDSGIYDLGHWEISYGGVISNNILVDIISLALDFVHDKNQDDIAGRYIKDIKMIKNMFYNH